MQELSSPVFHNINSQGSFFTAKIIALLGIVVLCGVASGYGISRWYTVSRLLPMTTSQNSGSASSINVGSTFGSNDVATFKDTAEGTVQQGGIDGEGQYHLVRPGGDSQNVYMTSSVVDLSKFIGHKVKVWGQTQAAKKAGWLMDVGRVEVES